MLYRFLADLVLVAHLAFALFALFGGAFALRYPGLLWVHLPALLWGILVQRADWICPLTPLENTLRLLGGEAGYDGGFVEHYVSLLLYPQNLSLELRYLLGLALVVVNLVVYAWVVLNRQRHSY